MLAKHWGFGIGLPGLNISAKLLIKWSMCLSFLMGADLFHRIRRRIKMIVMKHLG